jgi:DNA-binding SARP family transcriptional activator
VELGVLGPLQVRRAGAPVTIPGAKPRAILTMLGLRVGSVVSADTLVELLWGEDPPRTAAKALQTHISSLRRSLGDGFVLTEGAGWTLAESEVDASRYKSAARRGREAAAAGDTGQAVARFEEALELWRGIPELPDGRRGTSEKTRWIEGHAALVEDRADALLATGRAAEIIGELEAAVADAPLRERRWAQLMLALYRAGRQGEALGAYQRARTLLADELGVDPGPELRRLEAAIVAQDAALETPGAQNVPAVTRAVTFLLTDIEGSTAAWEAEAEAMGVALARHDELVEQVVTSRGGRLIKTRGEGDATFSVFERPSAGAAAALELQDAIIHEPWALREPMRVRVALHTGEAEFRDGDYFGRAVNRAARLRSLAAGGQILCSGATAELVIDSLPDDVVLADLGTRQLRNLARPEHVFELRLETAEERIEEASGEAPLERPSLPAVLAGPGPFVGRGQELERLFAAWQTALAGGTNAVLIAGEPGVGKTRLAGEWSRQAYDQGALVIYGRCDEDLGAPYQPFAEALRSLVPCLGSSRLHELRGVEALLPLVPGLTDVVPDLAAPTRADPDTERYALFDAVVALLDVASASAPVVLILDDLHWAAKPTLLLLRHLLRFGERARVQIIGTYRSTDLDRSHPLSAMLADLHRDGTANRLQLGGLDEDDVSAYVAEAGYNDEELARALASVTGGNPFFLIEALRHVEESGGRWDQSTLPQGVREAVSRRLSRLTPETNKALAAAAVVGSRFALELVERVVGDDLVDPLDEACKAGIVIEEPGGRYRFNHALVRQSLLAELPSVRRMRLHQRIATTLENEPGADDELLAELAHHYFECAWAGNAVKAVEYCRRAADQAMARLAYEGAADLYDRALHALEEIDDELPDRDDQTAELLVARCEALLAAGDVASAAGAVSQLQSATVDSARLAAWATCFDGQLSMLTDPERLDEVEAAVATAAAKLAELGDAAGEATAHTVRAGCLARLGRIGDCEIALDDALTAARRAREHRRVNAVLAQAPLAALWGPNPVPRAGGRCLDVVRLLRITTDSPAVEATSTRCQAVLEAFRGRAAAARRMIDSARRTVTELGLRHALLEVEQFAGIVELVVDDPAAAEPHLRKAYNGFRRMGLDADTAETAALLGRACLTLGRDAEADELCTESERLAGHALKPSIAWRTLRARLLSRAGEHGEARRVAEAAVSLAERTDALVDHGDACLSLATVLGAAGDVAGARAAAERAIGLYERKGAAALAERARQVLGAEPPPAPAPPETPRADVTNACAQAGSRLVDAVNREAWDEVAQLLASSVSVESRRKIVGFARVDVPSSQWPQDMRRYLETGLVRYRQTALAVRGDRFALFRLELGTRDLSSGAPQDEMLQVASIDDQGRIASQVKFDVEDLDAALAELDALHARFEEEQPRARRLENAATRVHERVPPVAEAPPEPPSVEPDNAAVRVGERVMAAVDRGAWDEVEQLFAPEVSIENRRKVVGLTLPSEEWRRGWRREVETGGMRVKHVMVAARGERLALARMEAGTEDVGPGAPYDELLHLYAIDDDGRVALQMFFDVEDLDAALAELDAMHARFEAEPKARRLQNAASRADDRVVALFGGNCWDEIGTLLADDIRVDDRRRGFGRESNDRATEVANLQAIAALGAVRINATPLAVRGDRLCLNHLRFEGRDVRSDAISPEDLMVEALSITEVDTDGLIFARTHFDFDDFDAAIAELDARYLAGEAAAYSRAWSAVSEAYAALNRHELPNTTTDFESIDYRRGAKFGSGELIEYLRTGWEIDQDITISIEVVHRLSDIGAVVTHTAHGTSREGFEAEWREVHLSTVEGDILRKSELFDQADLDTAIARFDQLSRAAPRLENAAVRMTERFLACFAAGKWDTVPEIVAENFGYEDRRRVVGAGVRDGRKTYIADMRTAAELWAPNMPTVLATRGERLALARIRFSGRDQGPDAFVTELLGLAEIDTDDRLIAVVSFDPDDFDAAIAELDARYLAGEAAANSQTWSVIAGAYAALNRREFPATTPDWVNIDHRGETAFGPADLNAYLRAGLDLDRGITIYIECVYRLTDLGAVIIYAANETSREGLQAEWRGVALLTVEGDMVNRCEVFREADIDAAIARFEDLNRPAPRLENAASQALEQWLAHFATRDWDAMAQLVADDYYGDDRRPVFGAGIQRGGDVMISQFQTAADLNVTRAASDAVATRGDRVALTHTLFSRIDDEPDAFRVDVLYVVEINADGRISALVAFDSSQLEAAIQELDARFLAGEAAAHAHTWSVIVDGYAALNRHELTATAADVVTIDHRRVAAFAPGEGIAYARAGLELVQHTRTYVEAVHRLTDLGVVCTHIGQQTSQDGFDAEWRIAVIYGVRGDLINRLEAFDEADLDTAITRFEQLQASTPRPENTATRVFERVYADVAARDWDAVGQTLAENVSVDDRRRVVNAGVRLGRDDAIEATRATVDVGFTMTVVGALATRGDRVALTRVRVSGRDPEAVQNDALSIVEIGTDNRIVAAVVFDLDDTDAAFAELDARYVAGEAAPHAHTWSVVAGVFAALKRHEISRTTPDFVDVDRRRLAVETGGFETYLHAIWDVTEYVSVHITAVHRLTALGAVVTHASHATSQEGLDVEWQNVNLLTVDGELISRAELFDEADLDSALARFEQLSRPAPRLENEASRAYERFRTYFAARDWATMAELLTADTAVDDHRRVVNAEIRRGRDVEIANMRAFADIGVKTSTATVVATRGDRLVLCRTCISSEDGQAGGFRIEMLIIVETSTDKRIVARVAYDPEDIEAAFAELDARYLTGEAAAHARTWSVLMQAYAALNRRELPPTTPDWVNVDHRRATSFASGDMPALLDAAWNFTSDLTNSIEAVHRLSDLGAVVTNASHETSQEGFDAEWRVVTVVTVEGDMLSRCEVFDEADLEAAIARFDELTQPAPRLENTATRVWERLYSYIAAGDWHAVAQVSAENVCVDDRRRVVNAGILHGRDANIKDAQATVDVGFTMTMVGVVAIRGTRLALTRVRVSGREPEAIQNDALSIVEIDADERIIGVVVFDLDDFDDAIAELDGRYIAGDAAAHAHTWSVIARGYAALNRRELPAIPPDFVSIDHRRGLPFPPGELMTYLRAGWDAGQGIREYAEVVHRLSDLGAVDTHVGYWTSPEGFVAEWRGVDFMTVHGDMVNRSEVFDEADLDTAIAKFEQLSRSAPRLENVATQVYESMNAYLAARDWTAMAATMAEDVIDDDRRRIANSGVRCGHDAIIAGAQAAAALGAYHTALTTLATRGDRLALCRLRYSGRDQSPEAFYSEALGVIEIDAGARVVAHVTFDFEDLDAAFAELEARYIAGEGAAHAHTWSVIAAVYAALNRGEMPAAAPDLVDVDHRALSAIGSGDFMAYLRASLEDTEDTPRNRIYIEAVHQLTDLGAVTTHVAKSTSREGFEAEWRITSFFIVDGDAINRYEIYDEADIDAAIARFEQLSPPVPRLENAATRVNEHIWACFDTRDWDRMNALFADDMCHDDRRRMVGAGVLHGRDAQMRDMRVYADIGINPTIDIIATRGERLALTRARFSGLDHEPQDFIAEALIIVEIAADGRMAAVVAFDPDDIDAAFEELDARYLAGEAAPYARVWQRALDILGEVNRHEPGPAIERLAFTDHRRIPFADGDFRRAIEDLWPLVPDARYGVTAVHALDAHGVVASLVIEGSDAQGNELQWARTLFFDPDEPRLEIYEESDVDTALARFEQLRPQAPRLENRASQLADRFLAHFAAHDWDAMAELLTDDVSSDDRRRTVNAGIRHGRDAEMANWRATADIWTTQVESTVVATRGERLALVQVAFTSQDRSSDAFDAAAFAILEINDDNRIAADVVFDLGDFDAVITELDARYLAGEAAAYSRVWSVIAESYSASNRHELPGIKPNSVYIDRRTVLTNEREDLAGYLRSVRALTPDISVHIEAVHRLSNLGAVITQVARGSSQEGFDAEWRAIVVGIMEGDLYGLVEVFDEADLDAALARFEELHPQAQRLENAASRVHQRLKASVAARDWNAVGVILAEDIAIDDRRRVVNSGIQHGRDAAIADMRSAVDLGLTDISLTVIATRGARLELCQTCIRYQDQPEPFRMEFLSVVEINAEERIVARVAFDPDDIDAAFEELDARYRAGEAATYAHAWSLVTRAYAALNRRQLPEAAADWVNIDHRRLAPIPAGGLSAYLLATWDLSPQSGIRIEAVHRLSKVGAVVTQVVKGTSHQGFEAEWRTIDLSTYRGDKINRSELFDEEDLDAALARFDELNRPPPLENNATRTWSRMADATNHRDMEGFLALTAADLRYEDRRKGLRGEFEGPEQRRAVQTMFESLPISVRVTADPIAIRGSRLSLIHIRYRDTDYADRPITVEFLQVAEVDGRGLMRDSVSFDPEDIKAAFEELDTRYVTGEAAPHAHTWSVIMQTCAALNRRELFATTTDFVDIDHRSPAAIGSGDLMAYIRAALDDGVYSIYVEAVHRLNDLGAVVTLVSNGTSEEGFDGEWRMTDIFAVEGDRISRCEMFGRTDLDAALERFEELNRPG